MSSPKNQNDNNFWSSFINYETHPPTLKRLSKKVREETAKRIKQLKEKVDEFNNNTRKP